MLGGVVALVGMLLDGVGVGAEVGVWLGSGDEVGWGRARGGARGFAAVEGSGMAVGTGWCSGPC